MVSTKNKMWINKINFQVETEREFASHLRKTKTVPSECNPDVIFNYNPIYPSPGRLGFIRGTVLQEELE